MVKSEFKALSEFAFIQANLNPVFCYDKLKVHLCFYFYKRESQ